MRKSYKNVEELENAIQCYFDNITITYPLFDNVVVGKDKEGKDIFDKQPRLNNAGNQVYRTDYLEIPSITGACRYLGICRDTWNVYSHKEEYADTIKIAKERIEQYLEEQLYRREQVTGIIFNLKNNFGWKDKQDIDANVNANVVIKVKKPGNL